MIIFVSGFVEVCCLFCGSNILMVLGDIMVEVIMKNISNRNMMFVIDVILKLGDILCFFFSVICYYF